MSTKPNQPINPSDPNNPSPNPQPQPTPTYQAEYRGDDGPRKIYV